MNPLLTAALLDCSYRLTSASLVIQHHLEGWRWLEGWCESSTAAFKELLSAVDPLSPRTENPLSVRSLLEAQACLELGPTAWIRNSGGHDRDNYIRAIVDMLVSAHDYLLQSLPAEGAGVATRLPMEAVALGEQLAVDDVDAYSRSRGLVAPTEYRLPRHTVTPLAPVTLTRAMFPGNAVPGGFFDVMSGLFPDRRASVEWTGVFAPGGWFSLFMALLAPRRSRSVAWVFNGVPKAKRVSILVAGRIPATPAVIRIKNPIDHALVALLRRMRADARLERPPAPVDRGWLPCNTVFGGSTERSALGKARASLSTLMKSLGALEYNDLRKKQYPHAGECRLPEVWGGPGALLLGI